MLKLPFPRCAANKPRPKRPSWLFRIPTLSRPGPMDPVDLSCLVTEYLEHCRGDYRLKDASVAIVAMTFMSPPEDQWRMLLEAVRQAQDEKDLRHIAAGPIEGLLGRHGQEYIGRVESQVAADPRFAEAVLYVRTYTMTKGVWARVEALQARVRAF
jgi:hypothetical protein